MKTQSSCRLKKKVRQSIVNNLLIDLILLEAASYMPNIQYNWAKLM